MAHTNQIDLIPNQGWDERILLCQNGRLVTTFMVVSERYVVLVDTVINAATAEQMVEYFQAVDGFILNSGYEGLSHVLLEALSFGLPTAASNVGGNPEVIMANKTGVLFDYNELESINSAVRELATGNNSSSWKIEADKLLNDQFAYSTMMSGYKQTLKQICEF